MARYRQLQTQYLERTVAPSAVFPVIGLSKNANVEAAPYQFMIFLYRSAIVFAIGLSDSITSGAVI